MNIDVATWGRLMKRSVPDYSETTEQRTQNSQVASTGEEKGLGCESKVEKDFNEAFIDSIGDDVKLCLQRGILLMRK